MRQFIDIINEGTTWLGTLSTVHQILHDDYWRLKKDIDHVEIWSIVSDGDTVLKINYVSTTHPMFNRAFKSLPEFDQHVTEITDDPIDPDALENAREKLQDIARRLRDK